MILNEWTEEDKRTRPSLPPTDTRFRPDIRQMEEGNIDLASREKNRLVRVAPRGLYALGEPQHAIAQPVWGLVSHASSPHH